MMFDMTDTKLDHAYVTCAGYFLPGGQQQAVPAAPLSPSGALQAALQMWTKQMMFDMTDTKLDHAYVTCAGYFLPGGRQQAVTAFSSTGLRT